MILSTTTTTTLRINNNPYLKSNLNKLKHCSNLKNRRILFIHSIKSQLNKDEGIEDPLEQAASDFQKGIDAGLSADEVISAQFGLDSTDEMSEIQKEYKDKIIEKLKKKATDIAILKEKRSVNLKLGKKLYEKGEYKASSKILEDVIDECGKLSLIGGEAQIWLAFCYQALNNEKMSIKLYKELIKNHPNRDLRKQAESLLFIVEAPKLELNKDEKITIPELSGLDKNMNRGGVIKRKIQRKPVPKQKVKQSLEDKFWEEYKPKIIIPNRYVWFASCVLCICLAWYSVIINK